MDSVTEDPIAFVLHQSDSNKTYYADNLLANSSSFHSSMWNKNQRTPQQITELKKKYRCKTCGLWVHWHSDQTPDGKLKPGVKALKAALSQPFKEPRNFSSKSHPYKKTMTFNMARLNGKSIFPLSFNWPSTIRWCSIQCFGVI